MVVALDPGSNHTNVIKKNVMQCLPVPFVLVRNPSHFPVIAD